MITDFKRSDPGANLADNACPFVTHNGGEQAFRVGTGNRELISVAHARRHHLNQYFTRARSFEVYFNDFKWFASFKCNSSTRLHVIDPSSLFMASTLVAEDPLGSNDDASQVSTIALASSGPMTRAPMVMICALFDVAALPAE